MKRLVLAAILGLAMANASVGYGDDFGVPMAHAYQKPRPVMAPPPSGAFSYTLGDMTACNSPSGNWRLCTGPDGHQYGCNMTTEKCTKVSNAT